MIKSSGKVSIVLATYNGSKYLRQAIDSCLKQTHKNLELIIVDDGSTDETPLIIHSYKDKRIKYIKHEVNRGHTHALNTGFSHATGAYLTWTSDDNLYTEKAIEKMLSFLKDKRLDFVYCDYYWFEDDDLQNRRIIKLSDKPFFEKQNTVGSCFLYSRKVKEVIGDYNPDLDLAEDFDYWIRISHEFPMGHLNEPLYCFRTHAAAQSYSKYYDVIICYVLITLNHRLMDINQSVDYLINQIFKKYRVRQIIAPFFVRLNFSKKISKVLKNYEMKILSPAEARLALRHILIGGGTPKEAHGSVKIKKSPHLLLSRWVHQKIGDFSSEHPLFDAISQYGNQSISLAEMGERIFQSLYSIISSKKAKRERTVIYIQSFLKIYRLSILLGFLSSLLLVYSTATKLLKYVVRSFIHALNYVLEYIQYVISSKREYSRLKITKDKKIFYVSFQPWLWAAPRGLF